jgi:hypothetical protein
LVTLDGCISAWDQQSLVNSFSTMALTPSVVTNWVAQSGASAHVLVHQLDVKNTFLQDTLSETVYCSRRTRFIDPAQSDCICLLNKSLYRMKQAPWAWYSRFAMYITSLGFVEAKSDTSLFVFWRGIYTIYLLLYVDDIVLTASSATLL